MRDTRFSTVFDSTADLLTGIDIDDVGDIETLLMFLFARPMGVDEVWDDDDAASSLDVRVQGSDESIGFVYNFPMSVLELTRSCADTVNQLSPFTRDRFARADSADVSSMADAELITALQQALGQVRLLDTMLSPGDLDGERYDVPRGICPTCGSGDITHLVIGLLTGAPVMTGEPDWVRLNGCVHPGYDRECSSCGATWNAQAAAAGAPARRVDEV